MIQLTGSVDEADQNFKKTKKLTWLCADKDTLCEVDAVSLDYLINKPKIEKDDDVSKLFNKNSYVSNMCYAEGCVRHLPKGTSFQFERRGYYIVDRIALVDKPLKVIFIPDGKVKGMSKITQDVNLTVEKGN